MSEVVKAEPELGSTAWIFQDIQVRHFEAIDARVEFERPMMTKLKNVDRAVYGEAFMALGDRVYAVTQAILSVKHDLPNLNRDQ